MSLTHKDETEYPENPELRLRVDPHNNEFWYRIDGFMLQFSWRPHHPETSGRPRGYHGPWYQHFTDHGYIGATTPERLAVWADLWVRPYRDSPELP